MSSKTFHTTTLENGLVLLGEQSPESQSASIGYFVKTGSRDETPRESGLSHFLEHMMFKGTKKRGALDITYELGNLGAQANAYTSEESTVFYSTVLPEKFSSMQELLSDMLRPALDPGEFDTERKVILEEIALYQDKPSFVLFEQSFQDYFTGHTAGNSVLGSTKSISDVTRDEMASYFNRRYSPANMVLSAAGKFDWEQFCADAKELTASWTPAEKGRDAKPFARTSWSRKEYKKKDLNQSHLLLVTNGPSAQDDARYPLGVLSVILGDSSGSKLYWDLVETGIAESAITDSDEKDGTGCFLAYASMEPDRIEEVKERVLKILADGLSFSDEDLERAITKLCSRVILSGELPIGRMMAIGTDYLYRGRVETLQEIANKIRSVTRRSIEEAYARYPLTKWCEYRLSPE